jgi:hypothetical protein
MNPSESPDPQYLARADERSLELWRHELVVNGDDRREAVIDELLRRATAFITRQTVRLGRDRGLSDPQIIAAGEEATVTLAMRLRRPTRLAPITALARKLAQHAILARAPERNQPPRLTAHEAEPRPVTEIRPGAADKRAVPPARRSIEALLAEALRRGEITRNDPRTS